VLTGLCGHTFTGRDHGGQEIAGRVVDYLDAGYLVLEVVDPAGPYRVLRPLSDCTDFHFQPPAPPRQEVT
jgi:hypothetical protein